MVLKFGNSTVCSIQQIHWTRSYLIGGKDSGGINVTSGSIGGHIFNQQTNGPARFYPESFEPLVFFSIFALDILFFRTYIILISACSLF